MTTFLVIVIIILVIYCTVQYFAIMDYKDDIREHESDYVSLAKNANWLGEVSRRRGQLLKDISNALPIDLRNLEAQELYYIMWISIQEEIHKELKMKS